MKNNLSYSAWVMAVREMYPMATVGYCADETGSFTSIWANDSDGSLCAEWTPAGAWWGVGGQMRQRSAGRPFEEVFPQSEVATVILDEIDTIVCELGSKN